MVMQKRYLITESSPNSKYVKGATVLVYDQSPLDQYVKELLGHKLILIDEEKKTRFVRPSTYKGVDPIVERRKWAKYHKARKGKKNT